MTFHRSLGFESAGWRNKLRNGVSLTRISRVVTASDERRRHFISENWYPAPRVVTVPLGVDTIRFQPCPRTRAEVRQELGLAPDVRLIMSAGHYGEEKGLDLALPVSAQIARRRPDLRFRHVVLGTGTPEREGLLRKLADEVGADRVMLLGQRSDPERWFAAADVVLHTPRLEAFGLVVVQAMASGATVLASAVGGIPELIDDGVTGMLSPSADIAAMTDQAIQVLDHEDLRSRIGAAARATVLDRFSSGHYAARQLAVYHEILGQRGQ